jgi:hypothetical protein
MAINGPNPLSGVESSRVFGLPSSVERPTQATPEESNETRFTPTSNLAALLASVRQTPDVRQEVIGEVARRLASGELFTRGATEQTVQGLLESNALNSF